MLDDYKIEESPLSQRITRDGVTVEVHIYRGEDDPGWILEVVDQEGASTVCVTPNTPLIAVNAFVYAFGTVLCCWGLTERAKIVASAIRGANRNNLRALPYIRY